MASHDLAGGRVLPPLLFITTHDALTQFGVSEAALNALIAPPHRLVTIPETTHALAAAQATRDAHQAGGSTAKGIVLLGGYDTLPARLVRAIDDVLLPAVSMQDEDDHYVAWNDDHYGDLNGDGLPELPVSRIPAGVNLFRALRAARAEDAPARDPWRAIRIPPFSYAESVYHGLKQSHTSAMLAFSRETAGQIRQNGFAADRFFIATHADYHNPDVFKTFEGIPVMRARQAPDADGTVVVAACCYSAQTVREAPLHAATSGQTPTRLQPAESIALTYVDRGAQAFIGFTGKLWVPNTPPYTYFGGPLLRAFWQNVTELGRAPAQALFEAKAAYILSSPYPLPNGADSTSASESIAKHMKDYWAATCLGLGW